MRLIIFCTSRRGTEPWPATRTKRDEASNQPVEMYPILDVTYEHSLSAMSSAQQIGNEGK
jgi:hypothetical protein